MLRSSPTLRRPQPSAVNLTMQWWNVVACASKPVHAVPSRGARHGLEFLGRQWHLKDQSATGRPFQQGAEGPQRVTFINNCVVAT